MATGVVQKGIKWSKRCKDKSLVGTTKEIINQVSNSKRWEFPVAIDENGQPKKDNNGEVIRIPSYSILQDKFYAHMVSSGFDGFERGERGRTAEHLSVVDYKVQQSNTQLTEINEKVIGKSETLSVIDEKIVERSGNLLAIDEKIESKQDELDTLLAESESAYESIEKINAQAEQISRIGRYNAEGNIELTEREHMALTNLAREGVYARTKIEKLQAQISDLQGKLDMVMNKFKDLYEKTIDFTTALRFAPKRVKAVIGDILSKSKIKSEIVRYQSMPPLFNPVRTQQRNRQLER
jgi:hypothetical protein